MYKNTFGTENPMIFTSAEEFYETLGFIANKKNSCVIYNEDNQKQGAWAPEIRMNCPKNIKNYPTPLSKKFTAGRNSDTYRINCTEFFRELIDNHNYCLGLSQDINKITKTIPNQYITDFQKGQNL